MTLTKTEHLPALGVTLVQKFPEGREPEVVVVYQGVELVVFLSKDEAARFVSDEFLVTK